MRFACQSFGSWFCLVHFVVIILYDYNVFVSNYVYSFCIWIGREVLIVSNASGAVRMCIMNLVYFKTLKCLNYVNCN